MTISKKLAGLTISDLSFAYRNDAFTTKSTQVLQKINLSLSPGEITYILGPNGAGKSTLVNCIAGILHNFVGEIKSPPKSTMGALLDEPIVYFSLRVIENIRIFLRYHKTNYGVHHQKINKYLEIEGLLEKRFKLLSQGQQQRVLLFLAMINDPDILLLDEPLNGLDPYYTEKLISLLHHLKMDGRIILINDHIISHTMRLADQIAFLIRHELIFKMRTDLIKKGLFYICDANADHHFPKVIPFMDSIRTNPPLNHPELIPIKDITQLYTIAVKHGRNQVV